MWAASAASPFQTAQGRRSGQQAKVHSTIALRQCTSATVTSSRYAPSGWALRLRLGGMVVSGRTYAPPAWPHYQVSGGLTQYFFYSTSTTQITMPNGDNLFSFESGQKERHFSSDGTRRIAFPIGSVRWL